MSDTVVTPQTDTPIVMNQGDSITVERTHDLSVDLTGLTKPEQIVALKLEGTDAVAFDKFGKVAAYECLIVTDDGRALHGTIYLG